MYGRRAAYTTRGAHHNSNESRCFIARSKNSLVWSRSKTTNNTRLEESLVYGDEAKQ